LENDTLHFKSPKHVTNTILQIQNGVKNKTLHLKVDEEQNLGKEKEAKLYPGISVELNVKHILHKYYHMFEGHYS